MRFSKYNHEGYHDSTVYEAFTGIEKERKQEKQAVKQLRASYGRRSRMRATSTTAARTS